MALILARGRRRDRFGQARVEFDDLPAETAVDLTQIVSAGLRQRLLVTLDKQAADAELAAASAALLARHDGDKRLEALAATLVRLLDEQGQLDEDLVAAAPRTAKRRWWPIAGPRAALPATKLSTAVGGAGIVMLC